MDLREAELYEKKLTSLDRSIVDVLLKDNTTKKNIIWATTAYADRGHGYEDRAEMKYGTVIKFNHSVVMPRYQKTVEEQSERTKQKAEVMTPTWICNYMNNQCDNEWFGRNDVFNIELEESWETNTDKIEFPEGKTWQNYVDSRRIEITCGEAPYLVSRYDTVTGEAIAVHDRIGLLDRKLRIVDENTNTEEEWLEWAIRAYKATYGFEYQGDNLLLARYNLELTFWDFYEAKWHKIPTVKLLKEVATIIAWNLWQMDGLSGTTPLGAPYVEHEQFNIFDFLDEDYDEDAKEESAIPCTIRFWSAKSYSKVRYIDLGGN